MLRDFDPTRDVARICKRYGLSKTTLYGILRSGSVEKNRAEGQPAGPLPSPPLTPPSPGAKGGEGWLNCRLAQLLSIATRGSLPLRGPPRAAGRRSAQTWISAWPGLD